MIKKIIYTFFAIPSIVCFQCIASLLWIISFGKIGLSFWNSIISNLRLNKKILWSTFLFFVAIDITVLSFLYLFFTKENYKNNESNLNWNDFENQLLFEKTQNSWNWNYSSKSLSIVQKCPSYNSHNLYIFYKNKMIAETFGTVDHNFIYDIFVNNVKEITIKTTINGKANIIDFNTIASMVAYKNDLIAFVRWGSFTKNEFNIRDKNGKSIITFYNNNSNWIITNNAPNDFSPIFTAAYFAQYMFANQSNYNNFDNCNSTWEKFTVMMYVSLFFTVLFLLISIVCICKNKNNYYMSINN